VLDERHRASGSDEIAGFAECAAAQYAMLKGFGFTRHLSINIDEEGGLWRADAVYTISPELPRGSRTMDNEVTVFGCAENGIPMV
jgi:hypothetical protein